jgi:hypothetical protein
LRKTKNAGLLPGIFLPVRFAGVLAQSHGGKQSGTATQEPEQPSGNEP